jgi:hypothetical protein
MAFPYKPVDFSEVFLRYSLALYFLSLQPHIMFPSLLSSLVFTVLALTAAAFWSPVAHYQHVKHVRGGGSDNHDSLSWLTSHTIKREKSASTDLVALHTSKCLSPSPTLQYQGINVTKVLPIYEVCSGSRNHHYDDLFNCVDRVLHQTYNYRLQAEHHILISVQLLFGNSICNSDSRFSVRVSLELCSENSILLYCTLAIPCCRHAIGRCGVDLQNR